MVDLCTAIHQEALAAGGQWAVFIGAPPADLLPGGWQFRHNPYQHTELVSRNKTTCQQVLNHDLPTFPVEAFIDDGEPPVSIL